jgi:nucleoside-diphosphate-sugar epimerase
MRVLITGGAGFIGSHLVRRLLLRGHKVTSLDQRAGMFDEELRTSGAVMLVGSVTEKADVDRAMAGQEVVYHLASPVGDILESDAAYWAIEVGGTRHVLESARRHLVRRVVHCSTQGVHGIITEPLGDEDSPLAPRDYYCYSKAEGEKVVGEFLAEGMDIVIVRPTSVYGPGDTRGWLTLYRMAARGWFLMIGDGRTYNHPVYVENLVDLFELVAVAPNARGRTYLAGDEEPVTLTQLVRSVGAALGRRVYIVRFPWYRAAWLGATVIESVCRRIGFKPPVFRRRLSWFRTNRAFRINRAREELGYTPQVGLHDGLRRTATWYRQQGFLTAAMATAWDALSAVPVLV